MSETSISIVSEHALHLLLKTVSFIYHLQMWTGTPSKQSIPLAPAISNLYRWWWEAIFEEGSKNRQDRS